MKKLQKVTDWLRNVIAPSRFKCMTCGADVFDDSGFCAKCLQYVKFNDGKICKRCGVAIHGDEEFCGNCAFEEVYFDKAYSPFCYTGFVRKAILNMKFHCQPTNAEQLAVYLARESIKQNLQFDVVTYVPMSCSSERNRGYNQSLLLATHFCDILHLDKPQTLLVKVLETSRQEQLSKQERKTNLIGAFTAIGDVNCKTVLLVDDIKTTSATLNECAKELKKRGASKVICLTVASREEEFEEEFEDEV